MTNLHSPRQAMAQPVRAATLRRQCLGFKEVLAGSLGSMGLCGTVINGIPLVIARDGTATAGIFLAAMFAFLLVAIHINVFASRMAGHGSLRDFVTAVFGGRVGALAGWLLCLGYLASIPAYLAAIPCTLISGFQQGISTAQPDSGMLAVVAVAVAILAAGLTTANISLSTRTILLVEILGLGMMALVMGRYMTVPSGLWSASLPSTLGETKFSLTGLAMAMVCFTGFEAASVLGIEAKQPLTMIPRANLVTVLATGLVTVAASSAMVGASLGALPTDGGDPFAAMLKACGLSWALPVFLGAATLSWFGCLLASLNTGGRLLYSLASAGHFWSPAGAIHPDSGTPGAAIALISSVGLTVAMALSLGGLSVMAILVGALTVAAVGFLAAYAVVAAAAVLDRWRHARMPVKMAFALCGSLTVALMLLPIIALIGLPD